MKEPKSHAANKALKMFIDDVYDSLGMKGGDLIGEINRIKEQSAKRLEALKLSLATLENEVTPNENREEWYSDTIYEIKQAIKGK